MAQQAQGAQPPQGPAEAQQAVMPLQPVATPLASGDDDRKAEFLKAAEELLQPKLDALATAHKKELAALRHERNEARAVAEAAELSPEERSTALDRDAMRRDVQEYLVDQGVAEPFRDGIDTWARAKAAVAAWPIQSATAANPVQEVAATALANQGSGASREPSLPAGPGALGPQTVQDLLAVDTRTMGMKELGEHKKQLEASARQAVR
jgi:hypothetical protein